MINFLRTGSFALVIALTSTLTCLTPAATVNADNRSPIVVAFQEESIPAADLSPSPAASSSPSSSTPSSPAVDSNPDSATWERVPGSPSAPAAQASPAEFQSVSAPAASVPAVPPPPAEIPPAMDVGALTPTPQISDSSLEPLIAAAPTPARAPSLRITAQP